MTETLPAYKTTTDKETLIINWHMIYHHATEVALTAQRELIALGALDPQDKRVMTRREKRSRQPVD